MKAHKKMKVRQNNKGFSLMELLITISVMAIVMTASLITYTVVSKQNVKKANESVQDFLTLAREKAMTTTAYEWNMTIEASGDKINVKLVKVNKNLADELTYNVMDEATLPSNVKLKLVDKNGNATYIGGDSTVTSATFAFSALVGKTSKVYYNYNPASPISLTDGYIDIVTYYGTKKSVTERLYFVTGKHSKI